VAKAEENLTKVTEVLARDFDLKVSEAKYLYLEVYEQVAQAVQFPIGH